MARRTATSDIRRVIDHLGGDVLLDDLQVAAVLGVSRPTLRRWRALRQAPSSILVNGNRRTSVGELRQFIATARPEAIAAE
jgi:hypothetical protein